MLRKLHNWIIGKKSKSVSRTCEYIRSDGAVLAGRAVGVAGKALICDVPDGQRLVFEYQAKDQDHFKSLWKDLSNS